MQEKVQT